MTGKRTTTSAVEILHHLYFKNDPEMMQMLEAERIKGDIAQRVYDLRETASLTQEQLAEKVGTTAKVIDDLEMTAYEDSSIGDAVLMLQRIAKAAGKQIEFRIVPSKSEILVVSDNGLKED
jgi:transcriptional regulator with XRE-family HTH domain